jgi:protease IV
MCPTPVAEEPDLKKFWVVLAVLVVMGIGSLFAVGQLLNSFETMTMGDGGVLYWTVAGQYDEVRDDSPLKRMLEADRPLQREMVAALHAAADDDKIEGLFLEIYSLPTSWAKIQELRDAVQVFAASGKPVSAWIASGGNQEYQLALAADSITLAPEGMLAIPGLRAEMTFLAGSLEKLGMKADYVHVGRFKSAPESYERTSPSDDSHEMISSILDDQYAAMIETMALSRNLKQSVAMELVDRGLFDAEKALSAHLIDQVNYLPETVDDVFPSQDTIDLESYALLAGPGQGGTRVAIVPVVGTIIDGESNRSGWGGATAGSMTVIDLLQRCYEDDDIDAVVLRIDSPGGSALASDLIWNEVTELRKIKPVVVSMSGMAASGGYYVACAADSIFAMPGTLTGSIGVFAGKFARSEFYEKIGVTRTFVTRGRNADLFADERIFSPEQREILQVQLGAFYQRFVSKVATNRHLTYEMADDISQGRVWTGSQAMANGLVDDLGGLSRALVSARRMMGLSDSADLKLVTFEHQPGVIERLVLRSLESGDAGMSSSLRTILQHQTASLQWLEMIDGRPLALTPVQVEFH